jgi:hypothetical protein
MPRFYPRRQLSKILQKRMDGPDFIAAAAKLGQDVARQHLGITASNIDINITHLPKIVERIVKCDFLAIGQIRFFTGSDI